MMLAVKTAVAGWLAGWAAKAAALLHRWSAIDHPAARALGGALVHFAWQAAAVAAVAALVGWWLRRASAEIRYWVYSAALLLLPLSFAATFLRLLARPGDAGIAGWTGWSGYGYIHAGWLPLLGALWMGSVLVFALYTAGGWMGMIRLRRAIVVAVPAHWRVVLERLRQRMHCRPAVDLGISERVSGPCAMGWWRPLILMPAALCGLPLEHLEALLAHELSHVRRRDYAMNLAQRTIEVLFFFHPAVWWLSGQVSREREHCCDDAAVAVCGDRVVYARALVEIESRRAARLAWRPAVGADGGELEARVHRVLRRAPSRRRRSAGRLAAVTSGVAVALLTAGLNFAKAPVRKPVLARVTVASTQAAPARPHEGMLRKVAAGATLPQRGVEAIYRLPRKSAARASAAPMAAADASTIEPAAGTADPSLMRPVAERTPLAPAAADGSAQVGAAQAQFMLLIVAPAPLTQAADVTDSDAPRPSFLLLRFVQPSAAGDGAPAGVSPATGAIVPAGLHIRLIQFVLRPGDALAEVIMLSS